MFTEPRIWDYIATNADNEIEAGGWYNSFDGAAFSQAEMVQYTGNTFENLKHYLSAEKRAVEIGCGSGITMFKIAPYLKKYIGTDMAKVNLEKNAEKIRKDNISNIELHQCAANKIGTAIEDNVDIVILNSVCQYFPDMDYFESVVSQSFGLLNENGVLYLGDILDYDLLDTFTQELNAYAARHPNKKVTKDRSHELWIPRSYFDNDDLKKFAKKITVTNKITNIENELTKYRFDVIIVV